MVWGHFAPSKLAQFVIIDWLVNWLHPEFRTLLENPEGKELKKLPPMWIAGHLEIHFFGNYCPQMQTQAEEMIHQQ